MNNLFLGIDLGLENKKTSAVCILEEKENKPLRIETYCKECMDIYGKSVLKKVEPYLKKINTVAIDSPLTMGKGKGKMRLFEKFFSQNFFKEEKIKLIPPSVILPVCDFSIKIRKELEKRGFVLNLNLIETSSKIGEIFIEYSQISHCFKEKKPCKTENQKSAFFAALVAFFHSKFQTRYIGYKDGFLFLPEISFWKDYWKEKFLQIWEKRNRLRYRYLITNFF